MLIKFRIKHPKLFRILKEGKKFLLIFSIVFVIVFTIFNGRAFLQQSKYALNIKIEEGGNFLEKLSLPQNEDVYDVPDSIIIPKINVDAPIIFAQTTSNKEILDQLENGVVHYPESVFPGQTGSAIILGHSSAYPWYKGQYGAIFGLLNYLQTNDEIIVFYQKHKYVYRVTNKDVVNKNTELIAQNTKPQLILISCWPVGTAWKRILIKAELIN